MQAGFLTKEEPVAPCSADALEEAFATTLAAAEKLRIEPAPEEEPYVHRYEEREQLTKLQKQARANAAVEAGSAAAARAGVVAGVADCLLGVNFMDTEELGTAQGKLESGIEALACDAAAPEAVKRIDALNHLGILWAGRGESERALGLLEEAKSLYLTLVEQRKGGASAAALREADQLENLHTLTHFYLAQAFGNLGRRDESAACCHTTMIRQLARRGEAVQGEHAFEPHDWARNAAQIAAYYAGCVRFDWAEHCLRAAGTVLATERRRQLAEAEAAAAAGVVAAAALTKAELAQTRTYFGGKHGWQAVGEPRALEGEAGHPTYPEAATEAATEAASTGAAPASAEAPAEAPAAAAPEAAEAAEAAAAPPPPAKPQLSEHELEAAARLDLAWADMYIQLLKRATALLAAAKGGPAADAPEGVPLDDAHALRFASLGIGAPSAMVVEPAAIRSFEAAREVYKLAAAHAQRAKRFFVLDGFVSDHFAVLQLESTAYASTAPFSRWLCPLPVGAYPPPPTYRYATLSAWEPDAARRIAMHKMRMRLLSAVDELNESAYLQISRQVRFDVGGIAADMLEIKAAMHKDDTPLRQDKKLAPTVQLVVDSYAKFIGAFRKEGALPTGRVEEGSEQAYLLAHFHTARALGKRHSVEGLTASLDAYKYLVTYFEANTVEGMEDEAKICQEMAELLPRRIEMVANALKQGQGQGGN